jgi:hypothetical protein
MTAMKKLKKGRAQEKRERKERSFSPEPTNASRVAVFAGMAGALALGAGVYANWVRPEALAFAPYLVAGGAVVLGGALWKGGTEPGSVRVGDAGVAIERGGELVRILWCDVERIALNDGRIVVTGKESNITFPIEAHPKATAWLVSEAGRRIPDAVALKREQLTKVPEPRELDGELVTIEEVQVAGRHCRATGKPIAFERDARLCPNCGEVYLKDQVPKKCLTCQAELGGRAREA